MPMDGPISLKLDAENRVQLQGLIKQRLSEITGNMIDDVLPEYVMVMVANQKTKSQVTSDLEAFLGLESSKTFTNWLWETLHAFASGSFNPVATTTPSPALSSVVTKPSQAESKSRSSKSEDESERQHRSHTRERESEKRDRKLADRDREVSPSRSVFASVITVPPPPERTPRTIDNPAGSRLILNAVKDAVKSTTSPIATKPKYAERDIEMRDGEVERSRATNNYHTGRRTRNDDSTSAFEYNNETNRRDDGVVTFTVTLNGVDDLPQNRFNKPNNLKRRMGSADGENGKTSPQDVAMTSADTADQSGNIDTAGEAKKVKKTKCQFWPACKFGDSCMFVHPTEPCKNFPNCTYGTNCLFIHPSIPCKFGANCTRADCMFNHPPGTSRPSPIAPQQTNTVPCKYGFACPRNGCTFAHPPEACRYGDKCTRPGCAYAHGKACRFGTSCATPGCTFVHSQPTTTANIPCKFGANCTNPTCRFQHDSKDATMTDATMDASVAAISATLPPTPPHEAATTQASE